MIKTLEEANVQILKNRIKNVNDAFQALDEAKKHLSTLEKIAGQCAKNEPVEVPIVAKTTSDLRECVNRILVGLIESQAVPEKKSGWRYDYD